MSHDVCPYWVGFWLASPVRRLLHNPEKILHSFVKTGMTVLDVGAAMGFFSLPLAQMVGPGGKVVCLDVQEKMLQALQKRARKANLLDRIVTHECGSASLGLNTFEGTIDFALAFAVVHEVPDARSFFSELFRAGKPGAQCLVAEPRAHVSARDFEQTLSHAEEAGWRVVDKPRIRISQAALLSKDL